MISINGSLYSYIAHTFNLYNGGSEWKNAFNNLPDHVHVLHLLLIAGSATAKEFYIAGSYIAKDSDADDNIDRYWIIIT